MKRRNPKYSLTGSERCEMLSTVAGRLELDITSLLRESEAPQAYKAYRRFLKSLDGAIRHAQRQRYSEERYDASQI